MGLVQLCRADGTGGRGGGVKKETRSCYFCKQRGHLRAKCPAALAIMGLVQLCRADGTGGRGGGVKRGHLHAKCPAALAIMGLVQLCRADGTLSNGTLGGGSSGLMDDLSKKEDQSSSSNPPVLQPSSEVDAPSPIKGKSPFFASNQPERDRTKSRSASGSRIRDPSSPVVRIGVLDPPHGAKISTAMSQVVDVDGTGEKVG
ncbi:hypothetical protein PCH_Pc16g13630 [Penicillium rubens Wisconsin 54-1255]|uniref:CCHC-type domain-containing protein n=1 Tax=Penicillium rubens (strain ATCC 28089 / DSM 1075 / NRRL 1951 / Wisconsin 54-1255) TaxID=500485 RepID=B6HAQ4_PENRW|nr:hypothetical protein PCH_Pc16g13630 [Penicillium rubens Wisconsin 54-1255]